MFIPYIILSVCYMVFNFKVTDITFKEYVDDSDNDDDSTDCFTI